MEFNATFLATIITFIVFVILMNKILYIPVLGIMEKRKSFIDENYKLAENNNAKSEKLAKEKSERLLEAKEDARDKYNETTESYKKQRAEIIDKAKISADDDVMNSTIELQNVSNEVKNSLKGCMKDLANDIVEKVIGYRSEVQSFDDEVVTRVLWEK